MAACPVCAAEPANARFCLGCRSPVGSSTPRARALIARATGDEDGYRRLAQNYLAMATSLGYHGHIAAAEAMI